MLINDGNPLGLGIYDEGREIHILTEDFLYNIGDGVIVIPLGFKTDRASIPTFFSFWREGIHNTAAIVHDFLYLYGEVRIVCGDECFVLDSFRREADILFYDMIVEMAKEKLMKEEISRPRYLLHVIEAMLMYGAVRLFGDKKKEYGKRRMPQGDFDWSYYLQYEE